MEFRLLGPLEVTHRDAPLPVGGGKQRALLAMLLLRANQVVPTERLIQELWRDGRPDTAENAVQAYISRLRKTIGAERIATRPPGYVVRVAPDELDVMRFEQLARSGRSELEAGEAARASDLLRRALELWRGPALAEFALESFAEADVARLEEERLTALEDRIDSELALGGHRQIAATLESLIAEHPVRERLRGQLMLALYRSGRQAEALAAYREARRYLIDEVGIDPSPPLQRLHTRILAQDPALDAVVPPRALPERVVTAKPHPVRKAVSVVAVDLAALEQADLEVLAGTRARARAFVGETLARYGAHIVGSGTDGLAAVFGVPGLHEDDALRAVRAALALQEPAAARDEGSGVVLRIGIETSDVLAAGTELIEGTVVADARRLSDAARPGEIVVGDTTRAAVAPAVDFRRASGGAWRVVAANEAGELLRRQFDTPLVGRAAELRQLQQAFDSVATRRICHLFTLLGNAGIGKSRLARELSAVVGERATTVIGRCLPYGEGITFWPLAEIVKQIAGDTTTDAIAERLADDPNGRTIAERIAGALGVGDAPAAGDETFWAFRKLLEAIARERPVIAVFEDIHWAESTLLDFVEHVAEWSSDAPILLLCLARPELLESRRTWAGGKLNATSAQLDGLPPDDARTLIDALSDGRLASAQRARLTETADGNPLFIEQMLALARDDDGAELAIPATIQALLAARIDRLPVEERKVLELAAIIGREFEASAVEELAPADERSAVAERLAKLVRKDLVRRDVFEDGEESMRFCHVLIRDAVYGAVPKKRRAELHESFANLLEGDSAARSSDRDELLGYHFEQAHLYRAELDSRDPEAIPLARRAAECLGRAGRRAINRADVATALGLLSRAISLETNPSALRGNLLLTLAYAYRDAGDWKRAERAMEDGFRVALASSDETLTLRLTVCQLQQRLFTDPGLSASDLVRETHRVSQRLRTLRQQRYAASAEATLAWAQMLVGDVSGAEETLNRVVDVGRNEADLTILHHAQKLIVAAWTYGPRAADAAARRCVEVVEEDPPMRVAAQAFRCLALLSAMQGDFAAARRYLAEQDVLLRGLASRVIAAGVQETRAQVELLADNPDEALSVAAPALSTLRTIGANLWAGPVGACCAEALYHCARYEEALALTVEVEASAPRDIATAIHWRCIRAKILAKRGDAAAANLAQDAVNLAAGTDLLEAHGDALLCQALVEEAFGRAGEAQTLRATAGRTYATKRHVVGARRAARGTEC